MYHKNTYKIPLYRGVLSVILTDDKERVDAEYDTTLHSLYAHTLEGQHNGEEAYDIILNFNNRGKGITPGVISHEALHAALFVSDNRDIFVNGDNSEPICYLHEWIVDMVYKTIIKHKLENDIIYYEK